MSEMSEIDVIKRLDDLLSKVNDAKTRERVLRWAWGKHASGSAPDPNVDRGVKPDPKRPRDESKRAKKRTSGKTKLRLSRDKNLNLQPKSKQTFAKFIDEKKPKSNMERCLLSTYYILQILDLEKCTINHVYTCFKDQGWRVPPNLGNALQEAASRQGWLDTTDRNDIHLTTRGENYVEHDLPKKEKKQK